MYDIFFYIIDFIMCDYRTNEITEKNERSSKRDRLELGSP